MAGEAWGPLAEGEALKRCGEKSLGRKGGEEEGEEKEQDRDTSSERGAAAQLRRLWHSSQYFGPKSTGYGFKKGKVLL